MHYITENDDRLGNEGSLGLKAQWVIHDIPLLLPNFQGWSDGRRGL